MKFVFILCGHKNFIIPGFLGSLKRHLTFIFAGDMEGISFNPFKVYSGIKVSNILPEPKTKILKENLCLCLCVISISNNTYRLDHIPPKLTWQWWYVLCANDNRGSPDAHWRLSSGESISPIHFLHLIIQHIIIHNMSHPLENQNNLWDSWWMLKVTCLGVNRRVVKELSTTTKWEHSWIGFDEAQWLSLVQKSKILLKLLFWD